MSLPLRLRALIVAVTPRWLRRLVRFPQWGPTAVRSFIHALGVDWRATLRNFPRPSLLPRSFRQFELHVHGKQFVRDVCDAGREAGIRPMLFWGTLLGFVREGGFIPGDGDVDFAVVPEDVGGKAPFADAMRRRGYLPFGEDTDHLKFRRADRLLYIDVDFLARTGSQAMTWRVRLDGTRLENRFPVAAIGTPQTATFLGDVAVFLPADPVALLEAIYGDWRTPRPGYDSARDALSQVACVPSATNAKPSPGPAGGR